ncbi:hypothetical protein [Cupriavidus basilensis]|uniref:hypothetical protein n=1 Tax=Cupriavidus basilensis TaxID=68895 RepID=UPI0039F6D799
MNLFDPIVPPDRQHPNFQQALLRLGGGELDVIQGWAEGFEDRDGKLVKEFQTTFNSTFWEVYLHGLFKDYRHEVDWSHARPDFWLKTKHGEVLVEAVTANAAQDGQVEWAKKNGFDEDIANKNFWPLNREAIIRLSNSITFKSKKYMEEYRGLAHATGKPFVIAVAPFEQPYFQYQYDRAIRALLYDIYVDETAHHKNPNAYPNGAPDVNLGFVKKDSGAKIDLGIFLDDRLSHVSAVLFSCVGTWGKAIAMSEKPRLGTIQSMWGVGEYGQPTMRMMPIGVPSEGISDGIQIFHNPMAEFALPREVFRRQGVVQHFKTDRAWDFEGKDRCLMLRLPQTFELTK